MIKSLDLTDIILLQELYDLQKASYQVEAERIGFYEIPALKESIEELKESKEKFLGFFCSELLCGAISWTEEEGSVTICKLIVHPGYFRRGIAQALISKLEESVLKAKGFRVSTGRDNSPALMLYKKNGFQVIEEREVAPSFYISILEKE